MKLRMMVSAFAGLGLMAVPAFAGDINTSEVDRRAKRLIHKPGMVGLAVAVIEDGEIVFAKGYGKTSAHGGQPVTENTAFRWASVSKSVAAATALSVAEDGYLGLSTPVNSYVRDVALPPSRRPVTLEQLLSHQTGLSRNAFDRVVESGVSETHFKGKLGSATTICVPGSCHAYQNVAFDLSTDMVEGATGLPYHAVVQERIFKPLGMDTASLTHEGFVDRQDWARPHNSRGYPFNSVKHTYFRIPGAAGVSSSVTDLAKWVQANMDGEGGVLSAETKAEMQTARTRTPRRQRQMQRKFPFLKEASYGLGWRLYDYEGGGDVVAHRGAVQGFRANVVFDPKTRDGVILLWNSNSSRPHGLAYEVMDQAYGKPRHDWLGLDGVRLASNSSGLNVIKTAPLSGEDGQ